METWTLLVIAGAILVLGFTFKTIFDKWAFQITLVVGILFSGCIFYTLFLVCRS